MRLPKVYAVGAAVAAATVALSAGAWATTATGATEAKPQQTDGRVMDPMRAEHQKLLPHIEALASAGDAVGTAPQAEQQEKVHESYTFLKTTLIPHAVAEDKVLYAKVDSLIGRNGTTRATDTMRRDHVEVGTLTDKLGTLGEQLEAGALSSAQQQELRRVLYSLNGIVGLHFTKEEEVYLPLLDRKLNSAEAQQMFEQMEKAAEEAGAGGGDQH